MSKKEVAEGLAQLSQDDQNMILGIEQGSTAPNTNLNLICMEDVQELDVTWIWKPYIAAGKLTILQGDPGGGKTTFSLQLASIITNGGVFPAGGVRIDTGSVLFQTAEDGLGDTVKPRLRQAGADMKRVFVIDESKESLTLTDGRIEQAIKQTNAKLLIIDPLQAYLGSGVDMHRANEVRPILTHLGGVAERTGCAVILICHMNKGSNKGLYRGLGTIDIAATARSVLVLGQDPENEHIRAVAQIKSSLAPNGKTITFELNPDLGFLWRGESELTADDILRVPQQKDNAEISALDEAKNIILDLFDEEDEWLTKEIQKELRNAGISEATMRRAKDELLIKSVSKGYGKDKKWYWRMDPLDAQPYKDKGEMSILDKNPCYDSVCVKVLNEHLKENNNAKVLNEHLSESHGISELQLRCSNDSVLIGAEHLSNGEFNLLEGEI